MGDILIRLAVKVIQPHGIRECNGHLRKHRLHALPQLPLRRVVLAVGDVVSALCVKEVKKRLEEFNLDKKAILKNMQGKHVDESYLDLLEHIFKNGTEKTDRTGTGTKSLLGYQMRFNLADGFPLLTTKKVPIKSIIHELLWFMRGDTNLKYLADNNVHIWDEWPYKAYLIKNKINVPKTGSEEWNIGIKEFVEKIKNDSSFAKEYGNLGPIYGYQWRSWPTPSGEHIDQLANIVEEIKKNPNSRRLIISAWNVADIDEMAKAGLPPRCDAAQCASRAPAYPQSDAPAA